MSNNDKDTSKAINVNIEEQTSNDAAIATKRPEKRKCEDDESQGQSDNCKQPKIDKDILFFYPLRYVVVDGKEALVRDPNYTFLKQFNEMGDWYRKIKAEEDSEKRKELIKEYLEYLWTFESNRKKCDFVKPTKITVSKSPNWPLYDAVMN
ncbi:hypothetical protein [Parasitella parasitica]|uniref:Uncharacterized protein n=1 Tax=Parasitella parasitica TaxID=35722 RepID=A0A0B7NUS2_9FUNG|nr:hypothetical protein [Parasitella parasitica]